MRFKHFGCATCRFPITRSCDTLCPLNPVTSLPHPFHPYNPPPPVCSSIENPDWGEIKGYRHTTSFVINLVRQILTSRRTCASVRTSVSALESATQIHANPRTVRAQF
ncbi:hypothetical protein J6590_041972 [Homalodisca vitripennis]|nr:hypothetical protein J6590_041972 [Homalodisca vitripennis]